MLIRNKLCSHGSSWSDGREGEGRGPGWRKSIGLKMCIFTCCVQGLSAAQLYTNTAKFLAQMGGPGPPFPLPGKCVRGGPRAFSLFEPSFSFFLFFSFLPSSFFWTQPWLTLWRRRNHGTLGEGKGEGEHIPIATSTTKTHHLPLPFPFPFLSSVFSSTLKDTTNTQLRRKRKENTQLLVRQKGEGGRHHEYPACMQHP